MKFYTFVISLLLTFLKLSVSIGVYKPKYINVTKIDVNINTNNLQCFSIDMDFFGKNWRFQTIILDKSKIIKTKLMYSYMKFDIYVNCEGKMENNDEVKISALINDDEKMTEAIIEFPKMTYYLIPDVFSENKFKLMDNSLLIFNYTNDNLVNIQFGSLSSPNSNKLATPVTNKCFIKLVVGPQYYSRFIDYFAFLTIRTKIFAIRNLIQNSVDYLNVIYSRFQPSARVNFIVKHLFIVTPYMCSHEYKGVNWEASKAELCTASATSDTFLNSLEYQTTNNGFCLSGLLVSREKMKGILGYANVGVFCRHNSKRSVFLLNIYDISHISNPQLLSKLISHEVGHIFSSVHDDVICPTDKFHYIMYSKFVNVIPEFSKCSLKQIYRYFNFVSLKNCMSNMNYKALCGNGVLEEGEECDCGLNQKCSCCLEKTCVLLPGASCSPFGKDGLCCNETTCQWRDRSENIKCAKKQACTNDRYCSSQGCTRDANVTKIEYCNKNAFTCNANFQCVDSICKKFNNAEPCDSFKVVKSTCELHCLVNNICVPFKVLAANSNLFQEVIKEGVYYPTGSKCMNSSYFCNKKGICINIVGKTDYTPNVIFIMNPKFVEELIHYFGVHAAETIIFLILIMISCLFIFELPYLKCRKFYFSLMTEHLTVNHSLLHSEIIESAAPYQFQLLIRDNSLIDMDLEYFKQIRICNPYLKRKQNKYPCEGRLQFVDEIFEVKRVVESI